MRAEIQASAAGAPIAVLVAARPGRRTRLGHVTARRLADLGRPIAVEVEINGKGPSSFQGVTYASIDACIDACIDALRLGGKDLLFGIDSGASRAITRDLGDAEQLSLEGALERTGTPR